MSRLLRIGIFTTVGLFAIVAFSIYVNDTPYWYRSCNEVKIHVDDASGLRRKSPVKTLGIDIGWIRSVDLVGDQVEIKVCVTGPVELIKDETRAYVRASGFLGDRYLELRPVKRVSHVEGLVDGFLEPKTSHCENEIKIRVDDANGLRRKSPIHSIGLEIGYINSIELEPDDVLVRACLNKNIRANAETKAQVRTTGLLGDRFLDLRPVDMQGRSHGNIPDAPIPATPAAPEKDTSAVSRFLHLASNWIESSALADEPTLNASRETELQDTMKKVGKLVDQLTLMVGDLREVTSQKDFKETVQNLNGAMKHLEILLRPDGKVMKNVNASMESLKNTMADAEIVMSKIKDGEGSIGKFINDPSLYDDIRAAIQSVNLLLGKAGLLRTYVDIGAWKVPIYEGSKGYLKVTIAPNPSRYYLLGVTSDPRGRNSRTTTTTTIPGQQPITVTEDKQDYKALEVTAMFGKYFGPLDLSVGVLEDSGAIGIGYWFDAAHRYGIHADVYTLQTFKGNITERFYARAALYSSLYVTGGIDQLQIYTNADGGTGRAWYFGAGFFFDDDDLKYLLAFK
jgi:phospholipid/cholesterol/gamma-HCH transport system substrate-binding protein